MKTETMRHWLGKKSFNNYYLALLSQKLNSCRFDLSSGNELSREMGSPLQFKEPTSHHIAHDGLWCSLLNKCSFAERSFNLQTWDPSSKPEGMSKHQNFYAISIHEEYVHSLEPKLSSLLLFQFLCYSKHFHKSSPTPDSSVPSRLFMYPLKTLFPWVTKY